MLTMYKKLHLFLMLLLAFSTAWAVAGDPDAGKTKSQPCAACHNADGNSINPIWPKLAGQHAGYLSKQLMEFRKGAEGKRNNPVMYPMAMGLTDQDIHDLAAYFASQKTTEGKASSDLVALGEKIYRGGNLETGVTACVSCHGPHGMGNAAANFPRLSYQHAAYTEQQLKSFKQGTRNNSPNGMMHDIAKRMTDEEIAAVSSYVEGLH